MDRMMAYPGEIPTDTMILQPQVNAMLNDGFIMQAALGSTTFVDGLTCTPTAPASMTVNVSPGSIGVLKTVDTTGFGSIASNANPLVKLGISQAQVQFTMTAPGTGGFSQNYLISVSLQETDGGSTVLPYYNASNPSVPYSGPGGLGTSQNTTRTQTASLVLTPGTPAATGTQTTPATPTGATALWVITVANGQTTITSTSIALAAGAPFIQYKVPQLTPGAYIGTATGTNTYAVTVPFNISPYVGMMITFAIPNTNTSNTVNINLNGTGSKGVTPTFTGTGQIPIGSLVAGGFPLFVFDGVNWELLSATAPPATTGRLLNTRTFAAGATTPTFNALTATVEIELVGGGGGSGGVTGGGVSATAGGGSGAYCFHRAAVSSFTGLLLTVGAGGAAGASAGGAGGNGTSSTYGSLTAPGGTGTPGAGNAASFFNGGAGGAIATGGNLVNSPGQAGGPSLAQTTGSFNTFGAGGMGMYGAGAGGNGNAGSSSAAGNAGGSGICIIREFT